MVKRYRLSNIIVVNDNIYENEVARLYGVTPLTTIAKATTHKTVTHIGNTNDELNGEADTDDDENNTATSATHSTKVDNFSKTKTNDNRTLVVCYIFVGILLTKESYTLRIKAYLKETKADDVSKDEIFSIVDTMQMKEAV